MAPRLLVSLSIVLLALLDVSSAVAQPVLDRIVGLAVSEHPVIITRVDGQAIGTLARAAGVPMGFEGLLTAKKRFSILATKRTLRDVLDAMVAADRRYEWREDDGVIVVRPVDAWNDQRSSLNAPVDGVTLEDVTATNLLAVLSRMVGVRTVPDMGLGDTTRFSLEIPKGTTLLSALNAMGRAHGILSWAVQPSSTGDGAFPTTLSLFVGSTGLGFGVPASANIRWSVTCCSGESLIPAALPSTSAAAGSNPAVVTGSGTATADRSRFERIVGSSGNGRPIVAHGVGVLRELADAIHMPMGLEHLSEVERQVPGRPAFDGVTLTGMTLQDALNTLTALDPRYQWHDLDGVIVFRPVTAWLEPLSPLNQSVGSIQIDDATMARAIGAAMSLLGAPENSRNSFPDSRTFSLNLPRGTVLEMLNGIARAHGEVSWEWQENTPEDKEFFGGRRFSLLFSLRRVGHGFAIP